MPTYNVSYAYDALNRIKAASDTGWSRNFGYDENGNMWLTGNAGVAVAGNTPTSNIFDGNNRMAGNSYDASGNQLTVNGNSIYYDAENRQIAVSEALALGGASERYQYDGLGQRVERSTPSGSWVSVYDAFGQLAAEYSDVATNATPCGTCYLTYDHLGSVRLVTDENGLVVSRHDYLPYGEEIAAGVGGRSSQFGAADNTRPRFTGQERDSDTGEDYFHARMFGSALGRFTSPDPGNAGADLMNPQSWNGYAYALGNPLVLIDPTGQSFLSIFKSILGAVAVIASFIPGLQPVAAIAGILSGGSQIGGIISDYSIKSGNPAPFSEQIPLSSVDNAGRFINDAMGSHSLGMSPDLLISFYKSQSEPFCHVGIGVINPRKKSKTQTFGFYPKHGLPFDQGVVKQDQEHELDSYQIRTTPNQDDLVLKYIHKNIQSAPNYNLFGGSVCTDFVTGALRAAGISAPGYQAPKVFSQWLSQGNANACRR